MNGGCGGNCQSGGGSKSKSKSHLRLQNKKVSKKSKRIGMRRKRTMRGKMSKKSGSRMSARRGMRMPMHMSNKSMSNKSMSNKKKTKKAKKTKKGKKPLNAYMKALKKARDADAPSFTYNGKTYYKKQTKTGMVIYGAKK